MNSGDIFFYILDAYAFIVAYRSINNSTKVKVQSKVGMRFKWVLPLIVVLVAIQGWMNYEPGIFRMIQTIVLLTLASATYTAKSGLCDEGIVRVGKLYKFNDANISNIDVDDIDCCVKFVKSVTPNALYFDYEQMDEVRAFLAKYVKLSPKKEIDY